MAQNADACIFWKLTFNRDFRSTEFQEIKINSCPALAASWGQCLLRGTLGTEEILGWTSSSRLAGLCPPTTYTLSKQAAWTHCCFSLHVHASLSNLSSYTFLAELLQITIFIVVIYKAKLTGVPSVLGSIQIQRLSPKPHHWSISFCVQRHKIILPSSTSPGLGCWNKEDYNRNVSPSRPCRN